MIRRPPRSTRTDPLFPYTTLFRSERLLSGLTADRWPDSIEHSSDLRAIVEKLSGGTNDADEMGRTFLSGGALRIWKKALLAGSAAAIDVTIDGLRQEAACEVCVSVAWMPASALAASTRKLARLLGLTSTGWPTRLPEDRLLSDHSVPGGTSEERRIGKRGANTY